MQVFKLNGLATTLLIIAGLYVCTAHTMADDNLSALNSGHQSKTTSVSAANFVLESQSGLWSYAMDVATAGQYAYVTFTPGIAIYDITNPKKMALVSHHELDMGCYSLDFNDDKLYVGLRDSGMVIVDVSDPAHPQTTSWFE